jgi:hypothetical protein
MVTMMAPRSRIQKLSDPAPAADDPDRFDGVVSIKGQPVPPNIEWIKHDFAASDQWHTVLRVKDKNKQSEHTISVKPDEVVFQK